MIELVLADTLHTVVRRPSWVWCGTRAHTMPESLATSIAATRATISASVESTSTSVSVESIGHAPRILGGQRRAARGPDGEPKSDRRARSSNAQPSSSGPGARLTCGLWTQGSIGIGGQPAPIFTHARASRKGHQD